MILAFDTASAHCAAALIHGDEVLQATQEPMAKGQAERLLVLCTELLAAAGQDWKDLDAIGVGIGPGNFTGIRIAVSAARGLALGLGIPAVGVSAFDALRYGTSGPCACAVDARRAHVFVQTYGAPNTPDPAIYANDALPPFDGPLIGAGGAAAKYPTAIAIAHLAAARYTDAPTRPAPLYLRPADAAPARDTAPTLLP